MRYAKRNHVIVSFHNQSLWDFRAVGRRNND